MKYTILVILSITACPQPVNNEEIFHNMEVLEAELKDANENMCRLLERFRVTPKDGTCTDTP